MGAAPNRNANMDMPRIKGNGLDMDALDKMAGQESSAEAAGQQERGLARDGSPDNRSMVARCKPLHRAQAPAPATMPQRGQRDVKCASSRPLVPLAPAERVLLQWSP